MRCSAILALLIFLPAAGQSTLLVPSQFSTIQAAIAAGSPGDTVLVQAGIYAERLDFLGKAIQVRSESGAAATRIDAALAPAWPNLPYYSAVRMISGEGATAVLEGFTVTGGGGMSSNEQGSGIWCHGLAPTIRDCVITNNKSTLGGGMYGNALLERCTISNNQTLPYGEGGGVLGRPTIIDCEIIGNHSGGTGGGVYATGPCTITGTVIDSNTSGNGSDGYSGGGVRGPATLIECQITRNKAYHYFSGGPADSIGTGVDGAVLLLRCTVADNQIANGPVQGDTSGGIKNVGSVVESILWGNENADVEFAFGPTTPIQYSIVGGGYPGTGNLALNPLFSAPGAYTLSPGSPAIDAGNPASLPDPDGSVADLGAYAFPQFPAAVVLRNGNGVNPLCYGSILVPHLGSNWMASVDATAHGFAGGLTLLFASTQASAPIALPIGELLIQASPLFLMSQQAPSAGIAAHSLVIPLDYSLGGLVLPTQAAVVGSSIGLCNALDLTLGL
jgi:hypothetical protein